MLFPHFPAEDPALLLRFTPGGGGGGAVRGREDDEDEGRPGAGAGALSCFFSSVDGRASRKVPKRSRPAASSSARTGTASPKVTWRLTAACRCCRALSRLLVYVGLMGWW